MAGTARAESPKPGERTSVPPRGTYVKVPDANVVERVALPPLEGGLPPAHILYLQRCAGGLELTPGPDDSISNTSTIPPFPATLPEYPFGAESWQEVVVQSRSIFAPFNIEVTDEDPGSIDHDEAVVCGDGSEVGALGAGGIAPFNCGFIPNAMTFTFPGALGNDPRLIAEVIAQEAAHAWGLDHELLCEDPMTYLSGCGPKTYQDIDAECGEFEPRPCDCGIPTQNSYQHILGAFGPRIADVDGPVVLVTAPLTGTMFDEGASFNVIATITDDSEVVQAELYVASDKLAKVASFTLGEVDGRRLTQTARGTGDDQVEVHTVVPGRAGGEDGPVAHPVHQGLGGQDQEDPDQNDLEGDQEHVHPRGVGHAEQAHRRDRRDVDDHPEPGRHVGEKGVHVAADDEGVDQGQQQVVEQDRPADQEPDVGADRRRRHRGIAH